MITEERPTEKSDIARNKGRRTNRLGSEKSPYLLQHADNPVDWYAWGEEAFARARREDKPIFLSIGYSTCHWCHVMERESFEDAEIANLMNDAFICIKVDREERPDIDEVYMSVCQMITGSGGWPLTIFMTPDKKPFFAGTYFPKESRFGRIGLKELVPRIRELWKNEREKIEETAERIASAVAEDIFVQGGKLGEGILELAYEELAKTFDNLHKGFGQAPKFPAPHNLLFLLRYWKRTGDERALLMVTETLKAMRRGGIYDHLGFGFHRYSTDASWILPHFEKMLYDQALHVIAYTEAYQATKDKVFSRTAREIIEYVRRALTFPEGSFYCAEDADSEEKEGAFYLWTIEEIRDALGDEADLFISVYNVSDEGNFVEEVSGRRVGKNVLYLKKEIPDLAKDFGLSVEELERTLSKAREKLFANRERRVRPLKDDKILADWNGLMISALAKAGAVLSEDAYIKAAEKAVNFVLQRMVGEDGRLLHTYRDGVANIPGMLDDYAFLIWAFIELYEATFDPKYLEDALNLNSQIIEHFWDDRNGGFFITADDAEKVFKRRKQLYDGAYPSGNSVAFANLIRLARITGSRDYEELAMRLNEAFSGLVKRAPTAFTHFLSALDFALGPSVEIVIVGDIRNAKTMAMLDALRATYIPNSVVILKNVSDNSSAATIERIAPYTRDSIMIGGETTVYICRNLACDAPVSDVEVLRARLKEL